MVYERYAPVHKERYWSQLEKQENDLIGYLRGDFGDKGQEFYYTWFPGCADSLNDASFKLLFDVFVNDLRRDVLRSRNNMEKYFNEHPEFELEGGYTKMFGFECRLPFADCYIRCIPVQGDYNFYIRCYKKGD